MSRILVVEDDNFVAMQISWIVEDAGYSVVGPERSAATTRLVLGRYKVDLALLNVNLAGEAAFPVSEMLDVLGIPFILITGHPASAIPARYQARPWLTRPCRPKDLLALIHETLAGREAATMP